MVTQKNTSQVPSFLIAASRKSSGKTTVSLGLTRAFTERGLRVATFKKGPDYIDPLWLELASGHPCYNLDFNTQSKTEIISTFVENSHQKDLSIIETNKGLFDGVDPLGTDSNAQLAKVLNVPVILVLDTIGITRGIAPLLHGYSTFDPKIGISGVILNKTGGSRHENKLRKAIETYNDIEVLGTIGKDQSLSITERHLGLETPGEKSASQQLITKLAKIVKQNVNLDTLLDIANTKRDIPDVSAGHNQTSNVTDITIAVARDDAFGFYYPDDLDALRKYGARLEFFSTLSDHRLPDADGLFIGGGFPETHMKKLEANQSLMKEIKQAVKSGLPTYGECGGLMYLSRSIQYSGDIAQMVGVIPGDCQMHEKPQGRGFTKLQRTTAHPWLDQSQSHDRTPVAAHEFHYASIENLPGGHLYAFKVKRGYGIDGDNDGIVIGNMLANFCHFRNTAQSQWAKNFTNFVRKVKNAGTVN